MKKAHKGLIVGGAIATFTAFIGTVIGKLFLDKRVAQKAIGGKVAGEFGSDDEMGADDDPIINVAKNL